MFLIVLNSFGAFLQAQIRSQEAQFFSALKPGGGFPEALLAARSAVLYDETISRIELEAIQNGFQQTGIDAVVYLETQRTFAGVDCQRASVRYLVKRNVRFLIFLKKANGEYKFYFTPFTNSAEFVDRTKPCWVIQESGLNFALKTIYQTAIDAEKKQNFLINDLPEYATEKEIAPIVGRRNETLATDIGYFSVAFPKFANETDAAELEAFLKKNYAGKYEMVDANAEETDLRKKGFLFILRYVHAKGLLAKNILSYETAKPQSAIASATHVNGELQLKTIPSEEEIYKFYFKRLETGEVFLGKWDADTTWQAALMNHIDGYKAENKLK